LSLRNTTVPSRNQLHCLLCNPCHRPTPPLSMTTCCSRSPHGRPTSTRSGDPHMGGARPHRSDTRSAAHPSLRRRPCLHPRPPLSLWRRRAGWCVRARSRAGPMEMPALPAPHVLRAGGARLAQPLSGFLLRRLCSGMRCIRRPAIVVAASVAARRSSCLRCSCLC
jgi:hypothetical protein